MKVTLVHDYTWDRCKLVPEERSYDQEMVIEMDTDKVFKILKLQIEMEALQQELMVPYKEGIERKRLAEAHKKEIEEANDKVELERIEAEGENLPV